MLIQFNDEIFAQNLKYLREKKGLTQMQLSRESGISVHLLRRIERGRLYAQLTGADFLRLCRVLRIGSEVMNSEILAANNKI